MSNEDLGMLIQKYRKAHKLSQAELAIMFGVSQPTVGSWETGFSGPAGSKRDKVIEVVSGKKKDTQNESEQLHEIILHQKTIIELLKDKIKGLGGSV